MAGVFWYRFLRYSGTDWSDTVVPIPPLQWYRFADIIRQVKSIGWDTYSFLLPCKEDRDRI